MYFQVEDNIDLLAYVRIFGWSFHVTLKIEYPTKYKRKLVAHKI